MAYDGFEDEEKGGTRWKDAVVPVVLILLFLLALLIRGAFYWGPAVDKVGTYGDEGYLLSGNDPNYHKVAVDYMQNTHRHLVWDSMLDYPKGGPNPNPPLYAWTTGLFGYMLSPFYGGDVHTSTWVFMEWAVTFWAALTIFPVYIFTRDMFGKKAGIWAAFFLAVMAGNVERTPVGFSDHDGIMVFFIVLSFLFLMRALRMLNNRIYVKDYFNARSLAVGTYELLSENKKAFLYALLSGLSIAGVSLAWKGVAYLFAIILIYTVFHLTIKKLKQEEGLGIALIILVATGFSLLVSFPYYSIDYFASWFESPFFVFVALCALTLLLVPTRDLPWLLVVPLISVLIFGGVFALTKLFPEIMNTIFSLQGYFVKTKLYETIAEAQPPDFSRMVFSYGVISFYLALIGAGFAAYSLPKEKWRNDYIMTVIWTVMAIYMAMSAVRFMYNATPIFAILGGWITAVIIEKTGFTEMFKTYNGLKSDKLYAIRKSVKVRHILMVLFVGGLIVFPNFWYGLDAGIPYEKKTEYDKKIHDALPSQMRPKESDYSSAGQWWLGSFGTDFPSDYWVDGMFWLASQDTEKLPEDRPAFISWWDYGHWAVHMGRHPAAADNFQNGFQWAGNYISAQNESIAIALIAAKLVDGNMYTDKKVLDILEQHVGKDNRENFVDYAAHPTDYKSHVLANPHIYGPHDGKRMDPINIKWLMMSRMLTATLDQEELVSLLHDLEKYTGQSLRYFAMDTRLLPVGPRNTGIFYAPIKLSDQNIDDFLIVWAIGNDGSRTNVNDEKAMTAKYKETDFAVETYEIEYTEMFYNSMFYKCYIGWKPLDVELNEQGIPTISRAVDVGAQSLQISNMPPLQGWGMTNHRLEYRTVYWNPNRTEPSAHPKDWKIVSYEDAAKYKNWSESDDQELKDKAGILDTTYRGLFGGVFFLKYYDGAFVNGTVTLQDGTPLEGVRVTVYDDIETLSSSWPGIPHGYTFTDKDGKYSILAPYGNVTIRLSNGGQTSSGNERLEQLLMQMEKRILNDTKVNISDNQAMRIDEDLDGDGVWDYNIKHDIVLNYSTVKGTAFWDVDGNGAFDSSKDEPLPGMVALGSENSARNQTVTIAANGTYEFPKVIPEDYTLFYSPSEGQKVEVRSGLSISIKSTSVNDISFEPSRLSGNVSGVEKLPSESGGAHLVLEDRINHSIRYDIYTGVNGTYNLSMVLPGNYTLRVDDVRYSNVEKEIDIAEGNEYFMDLNLSSTVSVTGMARLPNGSPASNVIMVARNVIDDGQSINIHVGADGKINGYLAPGNYSINGKVIKGENTYVFMQNLAVSEATTLDAKFWTAFRINGTVFEDLDGDGRYDEPKTTSGSSGSGTPSTTIKESRESVAVEFDGPGGNISMVSNTKGYYEAYLAPGEYVAYMYSTADTGRNLTSIRSVTVDANKRIDLEVVKGTEFTSTVYYDMDLNGMVDSGEALDRAQVSFDDGNTTLVKHSGVNGVLKLLLPGGTYTLGVQFAGYKGYGETLTVKGATQSKNIVLNPSNITVSGIIGHDADTSGKIEGGEGLELVIKFSPNEDYGTAKEVLVNSKTDGTFTTTLFPVNYTIRVDQKVTTPEGEVNYKYNTFLDLSIGQGPVDLNIVVNKLYKVFGDIYYDLDNNGILNLGERRSPAVKFYGTDDSAVEAKVTTDGYELFLKAGTYYYYSHMSEPAVASKHTAVLGKVTISAETDLTLKLVAATRINGVLYYDVNGNGDLDVGEQERDVKVRFSMMVGETVTGSITVMTNDIGEYSLYVPWDHNYTVTIDQTYARKLYSTPYTVKYSFEDRVLAPEGQDTVVSDLSTQKFYKVWGNVTYVSPTGAVKIDAATIKYGNFTTTSLSDGSYSLFVTPGKYNATVTRAGFTLQKSPFGNRSVDYDTTEQNFNLDPKNVTLQGRIWVDLNGNGKIDGNDEGIEADKIDFIAADFRAINASAKTDPRGKYTVELKPGSYYIWVEATSGMRHLVKFEKFGLDASGSIAERDFQVRDGLALLGNIYLVNTDKQKVVPAGTIITIEQNKTGIKKTIEVTSTAYRYYLPPGEYNLSGHFKTREYNQDMNYNLYTQVNLTDMTKADLVFVKEFKYYLDFKWDEKEKARLAQNKSVTYSVTVKNVGNEPATWEIFTSQPTGWKATPDVNKLTLGIGESDKITVLINISADARAGDNTISIGGRIPDVETSNSTKMLVDIIQVFNVSVSASAKTGVVEKDGSYTYYVAVKNSGNGNDKVYIELLGAFPGWNITIAEKNPTLSKGQEKDIAIKLVPDLANLSSAREMTLRIGIKSQSGLTDEYSLPVTFPDLVGDITVTGPGVHVKKSSGTKWGPIPGFEPLLAVVALVLVAVIIKRRGGDRR